MASFFSTLRCGLAAAAVKIGFFLTRTWERKWGPNFSQYKSIYLVVYATTKTQLFVEAVWNILTENDDTNLGLNHVKVICD